MATQPITGEVRAFPGPPLAAVALFAERLLARHGAHEIAAAVEVLVDVLDLLGGDPDAEDDDPDGETGDEEDGNFSEDEPATAFTSMGKRAGCNVGDPGEVADGTRPVCQLCPASAGLFCPVNLARTN